MKRIYSYNTRVGLISSAISERPVYILVVISTAMYSISNRQARTAAAAAKKKKNPSLPLNSYIFLSLFLPFSSALPPPAVLACHQVSFSSHSLPNLTRPPPSLSSRYKYGACKYQKWVSPEYSTIRSSKRRRYQYSYKCPGTAQIEHPISQSYKQRKTSAGRKELRLEPTTTTTSSRLSRSPTGTRVPVRTMPVRVQCNTHQIINTTQFFFITRSRAYTGTSWYHTHTAQHHCKREKIK